MFTDPLIYTRASCRTKLHFSSTPLYGYSVSVSRPPTISWPCHTAWDMWSHSNYY